MLLAVLIALTLPQTPAPAASPATCPATPAPLPAGLESWARPGAAKAGGSAAQATPIPIGTAVTATLLPTRQLRYAAKPGKDAPPASSGGLFAFTVEAAGRYRVALGAGAWVDVIGGGAALASVAHGHGPACSSIRKIVQFDLKPGRYLLQVAGSPAASVPVMVAAGG